MIYLILLFSILFFLLAWRRLDLAIVFLIAGLSAYLVRFNIFGLPVTLLEAMIWAVFIVWLIKNFSQVKNNFLENFKNKKIKIRYPFDLEMALLLIVALAAAGVAGFGSSSLGIFKAYFFEPIMFFIVVLNVMKGEAGRNKILWALAVSALAISALAIYQKITGQLIDNPLWAAAETRRVVSFFGYPNAVGLYLGPIALVMFGWLSSAIASYRRQRRSHALARDKLRNLTDSDINQRLLRPPAQAGRYAPRNDIMMIVFISLTIILSLSSIYFAKSKGALLGVAVGLVVFGLFAGKKIKWATMVLVLIAMLGIFTYQPVRNLVYNTITFKTLSGQIRLAGWQDSWKMLKDGRLLTGAGLANFQTAVASYHTPGIFIKDFSDPNAQRKLVYNEAYRTAHWQPLEIYLYPHNIVLNFWGELGLAGLLLFTWIIGKYFYLGVLSLRVSVSDRSNLTNEKFIIVGLICAMVVIVIHGVVDVPYFKNDLAVMFWLLIAMNSMIKLENLNN